MSEMLLAASSTSLAHILIDESLLNKMQKERMEEKKRKEERGDDKERREDGTCLPILEEASNCPSSSLPSSL